MLDNRHDAVPTVQVADDPLLTTPLCAIKRIPSTMVTGHLRQVRYVRGDPARLDAAICSFQLPCLGVCDTVAKLVAAIASYDAWYPS